MKGSLTSTGCGGPKTRSRSKRKHEETAAEETAAKEAEQPQFNFCLLLDDAFWNYVGVCCGDGTHFWLALLPKMSIVSRHFCFCCSKIRNQNELHAMFHGFYRQFHASIMANYNKLHRMLYEFHLVIRTGLNKFNKLNLNSYFNLDELDDAQAQQMRLKEMLDMVARAQTFKLELLRSYNEYKINEAHEYRHASLSDFIHHFWGDDHFIGYVLAALQTNALATLDPLRSGIEVTWDLIASGSSPIENFFNTLTDNTWAHNNLPSGFSVTKQISFVLHECIRECHVELRDAGYTDVDYLIEDGTEETGLNEQRLSVIGVKDKEMQTDFMNALRELRKYN